MPFRVATRCLHFAVGSDGVSEGDLSNFAEIEQIADEGTSAAMGKDVAALQSRSESTLELGFVVYGSFADVRAESTVYSRRSRSRLVREKMHTLMRKARNRINGEPPPPPSPNTNYFRVR